MTTPTDAELQEAYDSVPAHGDQQVVHIAGLRAVLAKWGTPPAVAGEPVAWLSTDSIGERYLCFTKPNDSDPVRPLVFGDTTPQPTQAQAGAVPLTDEQLYLERRFAVSSLFHLIEQWTDKKIQSHQLADEAGKIVDHVIRRTEAAHGIKGGQHGTE